jgi:chromosome segregation ATPase
VSALDTVIRVQKWQLDERRVQLAELERLEARLKGEAEKLVRELESEQRVAANDDEARCAYASYAVALLDRQAKLNASIAEVEGQIQRARDALAESFQEVKRYELAAANRRGRERAHINRKMQIAQDEMALQIFRRRGTA